jgi:hypothetical protein
VRGSSAGQDFRPSAWSNIATGATLSSSTQIALSAETIAEDADIDDVVGTLSVTDGSGVYAFAITSDPDDKFKIANDNELQVKNLLDYETKTFHVITVTANNGVDTPIARQMTISVTNVFEVDDPPSIIDIFPPNGRTGVALVPFLHLQFDMPIAFGDTVLIRLLNADGDVLVQEWTEEDVLGSAPAGESLEIFPRELEADTDYKVTIAAGSIESIEGTPFAGITNTWNFSTAAGVPSPFTSAMWSLKSGDEEARVIIDALPYDGGADIDDIEYRLDGGSWISSGETGSFFIDGLTNASEYDVQIRAVNSVGNGSASDVKVASPTAQGFITLVGGDRLLLANGTDALLHSRF